MVRDMVICIHLSARGVHFGYVHNTNLKFEARNTTAQADIIATFYHTWWTSHGCTVSSRPTFRLVPSKCSVAKFIHDRPIQATSTTVPFYEFVHREAADANGCHQSEPKGRIPNLYFEYCGKDVAKDKVRACVRVRLCLCVQHVGGNEACHSAQQPSSPAWLAMPFRHPCPCGSCMECHTSGAGAIRASIPGADAIDSIPRLLAGCPWLSAC